MSDSTPYIPNDAQQKAVSYDKGPLLVIAGAGTGKTTVIVEKIKYLLLERKISPHAILALTFTDKASLEMEERVDAAVPYGYSQLHISTFHAFADTILRQDGSHIGLHPSYRLLTQADALLLLRSHIFDLPLKQFRPRGNPRKFIGSLLQHFSRLRDEDIDPKTYLGWSRKQKKHLDKEAYARQMELAQCFVAYQTIKEKDDLVDFSDLVALVLTLFRKRPDILRRYRKQFSHILVDEFQDTNIAQYALISLLAPSDTKPHLTVVGDDSQAIYKFRGASVSNILRFRSDYPNAWAVTLTRNYRSYQSILDRAYVLIQHNNPDTLEYRLGISKELSADRGDGTDTINTYVSHSVEEEAEYVAKTIRDVVKKGEYTYRDCAILVRAHNHAHPFITACIRYGIPYHIIGSAVLFKQPEVKELIAYIQFLADVSDSAAWYRVLTMPIWHMDSFDIQSLLSFAKQIARPLYEVCCIAVSFVHEPWLNIRYEPYREKAPILNGKTVQQLVSLIEMTKRHMSLIPKESAGQIIYYFLEDSGYLKQLGLYKTEKEEKIAQYISQFFTLLKSLETIQEDASVYAALEYISMAIELGESPVGKTQDLVLPDAVSIASVHASKGLEYPVVFVTNMSASRFPTRNRPDPIPIPDALIKEIVPEGDYHLQEERRLCYVAVTRAKDRLYFTVSRYYNEGKRQQKISPFLIEMFPDQWQSWDLVQKEQQDQLRIFTQQNRTIEIKKPKPDTQPIHTSYSQIKTFAVCPKQYQYKYILSIPTQSNFSASFGSTIHRTLQLFYQNYMDHKSPSLRTLLNLYSASWIPFGYNSEKHEQNTMAEGKKMLSDFFHSFHSSALHPIALEQRFHIKLPDQSTVSGSIDRIDRYGQTYEFIDYKTGRMPDETEVKKDKQLLIYAYAATHMHDISIKPKHILLSYIYLATGKKITVTKSPEDVQTVSAFLSEETHAMRQSDFTPRKGIWCDYCPFKINCEAWQ